MRLKFNSYGIRARIAPAAITALVPIVVFNHFFISEEFQKIVGKILGLKVYSAITISGISVYFLAELARMVGKRFFQMAMFDDELDLPTTRFMLFGDATFSAEYKNRFRERVAKDFKFALPSREDEALDESESRKRIAEAVTSVRKKLHSNSFLVQHNVEYGAMRNSVGGAVVAAVLSGLNALFFALFYPNTFAAWLSFLMAAAYSLWAGCGPWLIRSYGQSYARILFREYLK